MSWEAVNQILGLAAIDQTFERELLKDPLTAIQARGFLLTEREREVFKTLSARDLRELSQYLLKELRHE